MANGINEKSLQSWQVRRSSQPILYDDAVREMFDIAEALGTGDAAELLWLLEHYPVYTIGSGVSDDDIPRNLPHALCRTGRGGKITWHGEGQRIAYVISDLARRDHDLRAHVNRLEEVVIRTLAEFGILGIRYASRPGVWVGEAKIAALGVRVRRWITSHGFSLNVNPDMSAFSHITPCGIVGSQTTSMLDLGVNVALEEVDEVLIKQAANILFS